MKRRCDYDGITRDDRRETNCRKKVKFADTGEEDDQISKPPAFQWEDTEDQNYKGHAVCAPKTSEYAFFKKLREERHQKSLHHCLPEVDDRARLRGNKDSSAAVVLNNVITAKLPTAFLTSSNVSKKPAKGLKGDLKCWRGESNLKCSPEVVQLGLSLSMSLFEGANNYSKTSYKPGEVFSRKRNNLLSLVTRSSLPEIGELSLKGCELASVLLSRLTPKGVDTLDSESPGMKPLIGLSKSHPPSYAHAEDPYQMSTWESRDIEDGKYLMDNAFSTGLNKCFDGTVSFYKPQTAVAAASKQITYRGEADCLTETFDADFPDGSCDFSLNLATMEDGFIPLHGWNCEDASWSSGGAETKEHLSLSFADWVHEEVGESRRFPFDAYDDLETLPRLKSWTFDYKWRHRNSALDEWENPFALSVQPSASPWLHPSAMLAASSKERDYMARQPRLLLDGTPSHSSPVSKYSFQGEDCIFPDWLLDESLSKKRQQPCPKPVLQSFLISSSFDLRCLSPAGGLAIPNGTLTRSPYQVPLASTRNGENVTLENAPVSSPLCLYFNRSSLYFLSIADGEEPSPGLPGVLN